MSATEQTTRRERAIELSGWGSPFHLVQPHNACFWVYLALVAAGAWHLIRYAAMTQQAIGVANLIATVAAALFAALIVAIIHWADRWTRIPARLALVAAVGGGVGSTFAIAITGDGAMLSLYAKVLGGPWAVDWGDGLTAPFVEETAKGAIFLLMLGLAPMLIRTVGDALIVGAFVGLGFQVVEDVLYGQMAAVTHFGIDDTDAVLGTLGIRFLTGFSSHTLYTALFSAGLLYLIGTVAQPRHVGRGLGLVLTAMVLHGVWDSTTAIGEETLSIIPVLAVLAASIAGLVVAIRWAGGPERAFLRDIMEPEVARGTITEEELDVLTGHRKERKEAGISGRRERHILRAARDLAEDLGAAGGADSPEVERSRSELAWLRALPA